MRKTYKLILTLLLVFSFILFAGCSLDMEELEEKAKQRAEDEKDIPRNSKCPLYQ